MHAIHGPVEPDVWHVQHVAWHEEVSSVDTDSHLDLEHHVAGDSVLLLRGGTAGETAARHRENAHCAHCSTGIAAAAAISAAQT